jgi:hypothetical protein
VVSTALDGLGATVVAWIMVSIGLQDDLEVHAGPARPSRARSREGANRGPARDGRAPLIRGIALVADCAGGVFVGLLMTVAGIRILWEVVPDLIDHPFRGEDEEAIAQLLFEQGVHANELVAMRSRRSGHVFVELTMDPVEVGSFEQTCRRLARLRQSLEARLGGLDLSIKLSPPPT